MMAKVIRARVKELRKEEEAYKLVMSMAYSRCLAGEEGGWGEVCEFHFQALEWVNEETDRYLNMLREVK